MSVPQAKPADRAADSRPPVEPLAPRPGLFRVLLALWLIWLASLWLMWWLAR